MLLGLILIKIKSKLETELNNGSNCNILISQEGSVRTHVCVDMNILKNVDRIMLKLNVLHFLFIF